MAVVALDFQVPAVKVEVRLVVIEIPGLPGSGAVAGFALDAENPLMHIVLFMAAIAYARRFAEC